MKRNANNTGLLGTVSIYLSKILLIYRTRNMYGYNSLCVRIYHLLAGSRKQRELNVLRDKQHYKTAALIDA
ncbi:MAG TPA: hypothetical protein VMU10_07755 [Desulfomonilia bacterium]|nr:hypothetical protein [Desulfomonilia bacterium]